MTEMTSEEQREPLERRAEIGRRVVVVLGILWMVGMSIGLLTGLVLIRSTQLDGVDRSKATLAIAKDARAAADAANRGTERIEDCTTFGRPCFQEGQNRTKAAVGDLSSVTVLAAACSLGVDESLPVARRQAIIETCIKDRLSETSQ